MKKIKINHEAQMPMLEIIIVTGIFTIISVFLLKLFVSADTLQDKARDLSRAVLCAENVAEEIKASEDLGEAMEILGFSGADGCYAGQSEAYTVTVTQKDNSGKPQSFVKEAKISLKNEKGKEIYKLSVAWNEYGGIQ